MSTKKHKLNIFDVLDTIDRKEKVYKTLTEDEMKDIQPLVIMRWLSGVNDPRQIFFINELVNPLIFPLSKHKHILMDLMTVCSSPKYDKQRFVWKKTAGKNTKKMSNITNVIKEYFGYSTKDAIDCIPCLTDNDILSYAEQLGKQSTDIKLIKKELKTRLK